MKMNRENAEDFRQSILSWYDRHRRDLPWRARAGEIPDPYRIWLSEIMLQQTTVPAVIPYFQKFTKLWPNVQALAAAPEETVMQNWAGLGYYARARNLIKCARTVMEEHDGIFPADFEALKKLPGIGDYTVAAIASIAFGLEANVVDGNVERVMARYHAVQEPMPQAKPALKEIAGRYTAGCTDRTGDYAQALMDLGATICTPRSPLCALCPVREGCAGYAQGIAAELPMKAAKTAKPQRTGYVFWITDDKGRVLVERRPGKGLLGGMCGLPTSPWGENQTFAPPETLILSNSHNIKTNVRHVFTHFDLTLHLYTAELTKKSITQEYFWVAPDNLLEQGLPTVFRKAASAFLTKNKTGLRTKNSPAAFIEEIAS